MQQHCQQQCTDNRKNTAYSAQEQHTNQPTCVALVIRFIYQSMSLLKEIWLYAEYHDAIEGLGFENFYVGWFKVNGLEIDWGQWILT